MKYIFTFLFILLVISTFAQTPQIARVSSDGTTTTIYTDIKKALAAAQDDDFIYLPGSTFNVDSVIIQKRVNIVGSGIYPDSTKATGKTVINGKVYLRLGREGGSIQGIEFTNSGNMIIYGVGNFTISKCMFNQIDDYDATASGTIYIKECVINYALSTSNSSSGNLIYNVSNCIISDLYSCSYSTFTNCIFSSFGNTNNRGYKEFRNCIFRIFGTGNTIGTLNTINDRFYNCHTENNTTSITGISNMFNFTNDVTSNTTFVGGACPTTFSYTFDYHLKSGTAAIGSGTDGTDKGIYGSMNPFNPNPYNPHIYFKSIAPTTNAQGQLQINVKVKEQ